MKAGSEGVTISASIALFAVLFGVASFWWLNMKRGKLKGFAARSDTVMVGSSAVLLLRLALVFVSTGARTLGVRDLRCLFPDTSQVLPLPWRDTLETLTKAPGSPRRGPCPFVVRGRESVVSFVEFGGPFPGFKMTPGAHRVRIDIVEADRDRWRALTEFTLFATESATTADEYLAEVTVLSDPEITKRATDAAQRLIRELGRLDAEHSKTEGDDPS